MSTAAQENPVSPDALLQQVRQLDDPALSEFLDQAHLVQAERRAPHLSKQETELFEVINSHRPPEAQARFDILVTRRRANKITQEELAELVKMAEEGEMQAAERIRAVMELAQLRGLTFDKMWKQLEL